MNNKYFSSFFFIFFTFLHPLLSHASNTLTQNTSISDGQTLISPNSTFEFGFFSPANSTHRYLGIWYYNISPKSVVWVANRANPITTPTAIATITAAGNLVLLNKATNSIVWSSNITTNSTTFAALGDNGNLVLNTTTAPTATVVWQSFDHPTNTFLPGMRVSNFTSWRSSDDPSPGNYTIGVNPIGSQLQLYMWEGSMIRWRSGQWDRSSFTGLPGMQALNLYGFTMVPDSNGGNYITYTVFNSSLLRFVMDPDGLERTLIYDNRTGAWDVVWENPKSPCDFYNVCGDYGVCDDGGSTKTCTCMRGFVARSEEEWAKGNWTGGCVRRTPLGCGGSGNSSSGGGGDGFWMVGSAKLPDLSDWVSYVTDLGGCRQACLGNCSCRAYAFVSGIGCLNWGQDLIDVRQFSGSAGNDVYVRLAASELDTKSKLWIVWIVIPIVAAILILCVYFIWKFKAGVKDMWVKKPKKQQSVISIPISTDIHKEFSGPSEFGEEGSDANGTELMLFSLEVIINATENFADSNKLGQGGFGHVYKGKLPGGDEIAVKRLSTNSGQGLEEFKNELSLIAKLQHRNLVRLFGCCVQGGEKMIIYEYLPNKSLDAFIFDNMKKELLSWTTRFQIIEGIARGLVYLHRDSRLRIVHRDLKASNVLLDVEMNPKISDFGMARIFGGDQNHANTNRVVGTYGYMSPEYAMEGLFSVKSDVYSFGVLVLEIISGRRNSTFHRTGTHPNLVAYVWELMNQDRMVELIDPSIVGSSPHEEILRCIHVGLLCVQDHANDRPTMSSVVLMLESESASRPTPRRPTFSMQRSLVDDERSIQDSEGYSVNELSMTVLTAR